MVPLAEKHISWPLTSRVFTVHMWPSCNLIIMIQTFSWKLYLLLVRYGNACLLSQHSGGKGRKIAASLRLVGTYSETLSQNTNRRQKFKNSTSSQLLCIYCYFLSTSPFGFLSLNLSFEYISASFPGHMVCSTQTRVPCASYKQCIPSPSSLTWGALRGEPGGSVLCCMSSFRQVSHAEVSQAHLFGLIPVCSPCSLPRGEQGTPWLSPSQCECVPSLLHRLFNPTGCHGRRSLSGKSQTIMSLH